MLVLTVPQVQGKKQRDTAAQDKEMLAKRKVREAKEAKEAANISSDKENAPKKAEPESVNVLEDAEEDQDVIF